MTRSVMVSQGRRELLGRERHYAPAGIDVHVELVEEIAPEEAIAYIRGGQIVGAHWHASDAGVADLEAVHDHELDLFASRRAHDLARGRWRRDPDPGCLERAGANERPVGAGVEQQLSPRVAIDPDVHHDPLAGGEPDRRSARWAGLGATGVGRGRTGRRYVLETQRYRARAIAVGDTVDSIGEVGHAIVVDPAVDLGADGGRSPEHEQNGHEKQRYLSHAAIIPHTAPGDTRPFPPHPRPRCAPGVRGRQARAFPCSRRSAGTTPGR